MLAPPIPANETQRLAALHSLNLLFTAPEERFDRITRLAAHLMGMPTAMVSLVAEQCQWFKSIQGLNVSGTAREISFCGHAILGAGPFVVEDAAHDARFADNPLVTGEPHVRAYAGHPIRTRDGSRIGTLSIIDHVPHHFAPAQLDILRDLAAIVEAELFRNEVAALQRALLLEKEALQVKAMTDGLTRLWNRTAIMELLHGELARSKRGAPMCVAMIDADHFKRVNDTYGHQTGDAVLIELATRIRHGVREFDTVGRFGGDEFLVVFSNCSIETATQTAQRIRMVVAQSPIATPSGALTTTVSIGLAAYDTAHTMPEQLISAADVALYQAKNHGRNCIER